MTLGKAERPALVAYEKNFLGHVKNQTGCGPRTQQNSYLKRCTFHVETCAETYSIDPLPMEVEGYSEEKVKWNPNLVSAPGQY